MNLIRNFLIRVILINVYIYLIIGILFAYYKFFD